MNTPFTKSLQNQDPNGERTGGRDVPDDPDPSLYMVRECVWLPTWLPMKEQMIQRPFFWAILAVVENKKVSGRKLPNKKMIRLLFGIFFSDIRQLTHFLSSNKYK